MQDCNNILRIGQQVSKCLLEIPVCLCSLNKQERSVIKLNLTKLDLQLNTIISAAQLAKAFRARIWHDSVNVARQLPKIGNVLCRMLVEKGYNSFEKLLEANPRNLEFCLKRQPPFGTFLLAEVVIILNKLFLKFKYLNI